MRVSKVIDWWTGGTTSSAFDDIYARWRADTYTGTSGSYVLTDLSGNGRSMTQAAGTITVGTAANGKARMTGNATARFTTTASLESWPITIITVAKRTAGATCGFIGHTGATPTNTLWTGYESVDRFAIYNSNNVLNTTAEAGATACYVNRLGYGSRVSIVNGRVQDGNTLATISRTSASTLSLGTEYRGLNCEWQETLIWNRELTFDEMDEVFTLLNTYYTMSITLFSSYTRTNMVIHTGDSMASGRSARGTSDVNVPAEYLGAQTNVKIWYGTVSSAMGSSWDVLNLASNNTQLNDQFAGLNTYFGPNLTIGKEYVDRTGNAIYILQNSTGSAGLSKISSNGFYDHTDNSLAQNSTTRCYGSLVKNYWRSIGALQGLSLMPTIKGIVIQLGTNDSVDLTASNNFDTKLIAFVSQLRRELGVSASQAKVIVVKMHTGTTGATYESTIISKQTSAVAAITNCTLLSNEAYSFVDGVHLNGAGNIGIGTDISNLL